MWWSCSERTLCSNDSLMRNQKVPYFDGPWDICSSSDVTPISASASACSFSKHPAWLCSSLAALCRATSAAPLAEGLGYQDALCFFASASLTSLLFLRAEMIASLYPVSAYWADIAASLEKRDRGLLVIVTWDKLTGPPELGWSPKRLPSARHMEANEEVHTLAPRVGWGLL